MLNKSNIKNIGSIFAFVTVFFIQLSYADGIYSLISSSFISSDSLLETTAKEVSEINKLNSMDKFLLEKIVANPGFEYLMRINSKAKIISKARGGKVAPRAYRYVGKQMWYKTIELNKKPYYGNVVNKKGYYLFWAKPLKVRTKYGRRFGGALVAKIDLKKVFSTIAEKNSIKFEIEFRKKSIFSNLGGRASGSLIEKKLSIYGMPGLSLKYEKTAAMSKQVAVSTVKQPDKEPLVQKSEPAKAGKKLAAKAVEKQAVKAEKVDMKVVAKEDTKKKLAIRKTPVGKKAEEEKAGSIGIVTVIVLIVICAVLVTLCFFVMKRAAEKNRKILEAIDRGEV